jgi:hypothetical protein
MFDNNLFKKFSSFLLVLAVVLLTACAGDDGEPGPKGDKGDAGDTGAPGTNGTDGEDTAAKLGYFQGTVSGHRQDGTAFQEAFNYEYVFGDEVAGQTEWLFQRFETAGASIANEIISAGSGSVAMDVEVGKGYVKLLTEPETDGGLYPLDFFFALNKGLSNSQIFRMRAQPHMEERRYNTFVEIGPEANGIYKFNVSTAGKIQWSFGDLDFDGKDDCLALFRAVDGGEYKFYYDLNTGTLLAIEFNGEIIDNPAMFDVYDNVKYVWNEARELYEVVSAADKTPLSEEIGFVPADEFTITNYKNENGAISFDFSITVSKYRGFIGHREPGPFPFYLMDGFNTTGHDLTITGKYSSGGKYYTEEVGRIKG